MNMDDCHRVLLPGAVDTSVGLQVCLYASAWSVPDDRIRSGKGQPVGCSLRLDDENLRARLVLKPSNNICAAVDRHVSVYNFTLNTIFCQVFVQKFDCVRKRHEYERLVAALIDDLLHHAKSVGHIKVNDLSGVGVHGAAGNL